MRTPTRKRAIHTSVTKRIHCRARIGLHPLGPCARPLYRKHASLVFRLSDAPVVSSPTDGLLPLAPLRGGGFLHIRARIEKAPLA